MFARLVDQAKAAVSSLVLKYVARASVAIPFVIALGFALTAITIMLVERFGHVAAYWTMAGGLAAIGIIAAVAVTAKEHEEELGEQKAAAANTQHVMSDATAQAITQAPLAALGTLFAMPGGTANALKAARIVGRHWPLALLLVMIGVLFWPTEGNGATADGVEPARKPDGSDAVETYH